MRIVFNYKNSRCKSLQREKQSKSYATKTYESYRNRNKKAKTGKNFYKSALFLNTSHSSFQTLFLNTCLVLQVLSQWPGLPSGVKFEPTDVELLRHLEGKVGTAAPHVLIDEFIPTIEEEEGMCYTHPENLPGNRFLLCTYYQDLPN